MTHSATTLGRRAAALLIPVLGVLALGACGEDRSPQPSGTLEATEIDLSPLVGGKVLEVRPQEGERVSAGDTLLVIDTEQIALQHEQALARLSALEAQEGELAARERQAQERFTLADSTAARTEYLLAQGSARRQQLDELRTERELAAAELAGVAARRKALAAQRAEARAAAAVFARQIADGILLAPSSGTVLLRMLEPGETAAPGRLALRIADLRQLDLRVYLENGDLDRVRLGERLPVRVDALAGDELEGTVTWISSEAEFTPKNVQTRNARAQLVYAVKLRLANPDGRLHIGMPAELILKDAGGGGGA